MNSSRRDTLLASGVATGVLGSASGSAAAQAGDYPHWGEQPEHVTLTFDEETLLDYAPRLIFETEAREKFQRLRGWTATSPDYDYDWHVFVALYTNQIGFGPDTHLGDTEWYYVASNPETGATERVVYDAYHWLAGKLRASEITLDGTHPVTKVVSPWHPYRHVGVDAEQAIAIDSVGDLTEQFDDMLADGLAESLHPGTVVDPARMDIGGRPHWWQTTVGEFSFDAFYAELLYDIGLTGADKVDPGALEI